MFFRKAIVRIPCVRMVEGLSTAGLGIPDYHLALHQHDQYVRALKSCGLEVYMLPPDHDFPDSTFVEDTALLTPEVAVITCPGAPSRSGEIESMKGYIKRFYNNIVSIKMPGTLEAGDVMMAGKHFYIGLSERTNKEGAKQLIHILENYGMRGTMVNISGMLHLKSGVSYLENNHLLAAGPLAEHPAFKDYHIISVPDKEAYAANSLWINGTVLVPEGYPLSLQKIRDCGYDTMVMAMSEFQKLDGGLSCLSLRF